jgi:HlyD family secretion protein
MVVDAGVAHQRTVETGIEDSGLVQILSGLKPGEQVVSTGAYAMDDGTKVKVLTAEDMEKESSEKPKAGGGAE